MDLLLSNDYDSDDENFPPSYCMTRKKFPSRDPTPEPAPCPSMDDMDIETDDNKVSLGNSEDERPPPISVPITPSADIYNYLEYGDVLRYALS